MHFLSDMLVMKHWSVNITRGRPVDNWWQYFHTIEEDDKMKKAQCQQCQALVSAKADRLRTHLSKMCNV